MKFLYAFLSTALAGALAFVLSISVGPLPPLATFFDPFAGFWANAETSDGKKDRTLSLSGLTAPVQVVMDNRGVPHIFAQNAYDLYFAQGYATAVDRLFQMEFGARAAAGRLSEVLGDRTLAYDRYQRNIGMAWAAENMMKAVESDAAGKLVMEAYADGVNAYINQLRARDLPVEFKLLNYRPEPWSAFKSALVSKNMQYTLTGYSDELPMSNSKMLFSAEDFDTLFPLYSPYQDPIVPDTTPFRFTPVPLPTAPEATFQPKVAAPAPQFQPDKANGSNNWAVHGSKTLSGYPILSNDMHLGNTLPAIWYEVQLNSPEVNVYGVSIPGVPTVIVGFNEQIAWGFTNVGADVMDWYEITFKDASRNEYQYEGAWLPVVNREEIIRIKGKPVFADTVKFTHHGPVAYKSGESPMFEHIPAGHALRWTAHGEENVLQAFIKLNAAQNYEAYVEAVSFLANPGQNIAYADRAGNIALYVTGKHPVRWKQQGRFVSDGSKKAYEWSSFIPHDQKPNLKNPARGFVSSANQFSADPAAYPYYLGWDFASYERGSRINQRLQEMNEITANDMRLLQMDAKSLHAQRMLPALLDAVEIDSLTEVETEAYLSLKGWDFVNRGEEMAPSVFNAWWSVFNSTVWSDEFPDGTYEWPSRPVTVKLALESPDSKWFDDKSTPATEQFRDIARIAFKKAIQNLEKNNGKPGPAWRWSKQKAYRLPNLARLPGFGVDFLETSGCSECVNATQDNHGPSWRMVVDLSPEGKAMGIYPGGQSGNPGSKNYEADIKEWAAGHLHTLYLLRSPNELPEIVHYSLLMKGN